VLIEEAQKRETAEVRKNQAIEVAKQEKHVAVANAEAEKAGAQATQRLAEAKEREAAEKVTTAAEVEIADRAKQTAVIAAEKDGETQLIEQQKSADAAAYTKTREAQADKESAENEAEAIEKLAVANLVAKEKEADGEKAVKMVPVDVDREQVNVEAARVEVLKTELEAKDTFQEAAIRLELGKMEIVAGEHVGIEMAKAFGQFMSNGDFSIFGTPETLATMSDRFAAGMGLTKFIDGMSSDGSPLGDLVQTAIDTSKSGLEAAQTKAEEVTDKKKGKAKDNKIPEEEAPAS